MRGLNHYIAVAKTRKGKRRRKNEKKGDKTRGSRIKKKLLWAWGDCYYWKKVYNSFGYISAFFMLCWSYSPNRAAVGCSGTGTWQQLLGLNSTLISRAYVHTDYMDLDLSDCKGSITPTPTTATATVAVARFVFV